MKRLILILLSLLLILGCLGCRKNEEQLEKPAKFYYRNSEVDYGVEDGLISFELQESNHIGNDLNALIHQYQQGPVSATLVNPLTQDINITGVETQGGVITVCTDTSFSQLSGIDRTIACASISMTLLDYTNAKYIKICIVDDLLGEQESLVLSRNDMQFLDSYPASTETTQ